MLRIGTLSKTLASLGGFVAGPQAFIDLIINTARSFIFTTAPTPADAAEPFAQGRVRNILSKLGANDRTHAVTIGLKRGIIEL